MVEQDDFFMDAGVPDEDERPMFDLRELVVYSLGRAHWLIATCAGLGLCAGLFLAFSKANFYGSLGRLRYTPGDQETKRVDELFDVNDRVNLIPTGIPDEIKLIENPIVHERVAKRIGIKRMLTPPDPTISDRGKKAKSLVGRIHKAQRWYFNRNAYVESPRFDPTSPGAIEAATIRCRDALTLYHDGDTNYIDVVIFANNARLAQDICDAYMDEARTWHSEFYSLEDRSELIREELHSARRKTELAQIAFDEHKEGCGHENVPAQLEYLRGDMNVLSFSIRSTTTELESVEAELAVLRRQIDETPKKKTIVIDAKKDPNPDYVRVRDDREELYSKLEKVESELQPNSTEYRQQKSRLEAQIEQLTEELSGLEPYDIIEPRREEEIDNEAYTDLVELLGASIRNKTGLEVKIGSYKEDLDELRGELSSVLACQIKHEDYQDAIRIAKEFEHKVTFQFEEAERENRRKQNEEVQSLRIVQPATFEPGKKGPSRTKLVIGGIVGGIGVGIALAILRQLIDGTARYPRGIANKLGVPVVGVVAEVSAWRKTSRKA